MADGARDHALAFASIDDLQRVEKALQTLESEADSGARAVVTVVGAGYAGA
jgi:NADH dehydrogenase FAD-containing subunit